jgi:predicted dinucleotide-binding enzyme
MTHVTIIGTGNMGQAISGLVSKGGNTVEPLRHSSASAAQSSTALATV